MYQVLCVGDVTIDAFFHLSDDNHKVHLDAEKKELCVPYGDKINVQSTDFTIGGNAANVAVGLKRLGVHVGLCTEVGDDEFSLKVINALAKEGIDRSTIIHDRNSPTSLSVALNFKGDRTLFVEHVKRKHNFHFTGITSEVMYLTSLGHEWEDAYKKALEYSIDQKVKIAFNPGSVQLAEKSLLIDKVLKHTELLFVNKEEAMKISNFSAKRGFNDREEIKKLLTKVQLLGPRVVVVTDGKHGSYCLDTQGNFYHFGCIPSQVMERTGAGDSYAAGFLAAIAHDLDLHTAMKWGSTNAASVVTKVGAQAGLLKKEEMEKRVKE